MDESHKDVPRELIPLDELGPPPANYSPAVRVGSQVFVSGMIAMHDGAVVGIGDVTKQTRVVIGHIETALRNAGAAFADVVRYRIYLTDIADLAEVRTVLGSAFRSQIGRA